MPMDTVSWAKFSALCSLGYLIRPRGATKDARAIEATQWRGLSLRDPRTFGDRLRPEFRAGRRQASVDPRGNPNGYCSRRCRNALMADMTIGGSRFWAMVEGVTKLLSPGRRRKSVE